MTFLPLIAPMVLLAIAGALTLRPAARGHWMLRLPEWGALLALALGIASAIGYALIGPATSPLIGVATVGLSARVDVVSLAMFLTVGMVGWVVLRYSRVALDGEDRHSPFMAGMATTLACVMLLVTAGNLVQLVVAWVAVGVGLHKLLLFYPDRPRAQRAAKKKTVSGIIGSAALVGAAGLMVWGYGTADIASITQAARGGEVPPLVWLAALLLAVAAVHKSALFPTHGWLTEVMEAPTPVSALLHAGVVNAGGFLLIRFADVLLSAPGILALLALIGGFSALIGAAVALTQPAVKTALAWSTCAQMGFMVLQCGLALFPLALLHIVAHSLYKAHAFLASGGAVEQVASIRRPGPVAVPNGRAVLKSFALALALYAIIGLLLGIDGKSAQAIVLGAVLVMGVAYLLAQGLADAAPEVLTRRMAAYSVATTLSYFALQSIAIWLTTGALPATPAPGPLQWALMVLTILSFGTVAWAQATFPNWASHPAAQGLRVHLSNGFYLNAVFDRLTGGWAARNR